VSPEQPAPNAVVASSEPHVAQTAEPTSPEAVHAREGELIQGQQPTDAAADQVGDNKQVEEQSTVPVSPEQPAPNAVVASSEPHVAQTAEPTSPEAVHAREGELIQGAVVDKQPQHYDVVKATLNDVSELHDASAGSDTDDAPEIISDSVSRDHDHHDHQHPPVGRNYFITSS